MQKECDRCEKTGKEANVVYSCGDAYIFCNECLEEYNKAPSNENIQDFLKNGPNWLKKRIKRAKEKREKGESPWS